MPVCPSVCKNCAPTGRILVKVDTENFCEVSRKLKFRFKFKAYEHSWQYLAELFLEWGVFQTKVVEIIKAHIFVSNSFFPPRKSCRLLSAPLYRHWGSVKAVRPIGGVEVQLYSFLTTALEGGEGSASRPGRSLPLGKTRYPLHRRLGGPQGRSRQVRKISPPHRDSIPGPSSP